MSNTPYTLACQSQGRVQHGSILSGNLRPTRVTSQWKSTDTATNLTIKTVARVFHHLGETAYLTTLEEFERQLAEARGAHTDDNAHRWTVVGLESDKFQMAGDVALADAPTAADVSASNRSFERWLRAEAALPRRTAAAAA